jgi:hypothetical protein
MTPSPHDDRSQRLAALRDEITEHRAEADRRAQALAACQNELNECTAQRQAWTARAAEVSREHGLHGAHASVAWDKVGKLERQVLGLEAELAAEARAAERAEQEAEHAR